MEKEQTTTRPARNDASPASPRSFHPTVEQADGAPGWRILIVDDELIMRELLSELVDSVASRIDAAASFADGRRCLSQAEYDWVLLDNRLGDGAGLELLKEMHHNGSGARVVMITAEAHKPEFIQRATENGAERVIGKPFDPREIVDLLSRSARS